MSGTTGASLCVTQGHMAHKGAKILLPMISMSLTAYNLQVLQILVLWLDRILFFLSLPSDCHVFLDWKFLRADCIP